MMPVVNRIKRNLMNGSSNWDTGMALFRIRIFLFGNKEDEQGFILKFIIYFLLTDLALLYLGPILFMLSTALMSFSDMMDPTVKWIPKEAKLINFYQAYQQMSIKLNFVKNRNLWDNLRSSTLFNSVTITFPSVIAQVLSCAVAGYAFGRLKFPGKKILYVVLILTFLIPSQTIIMPLSLIYREYGLKDTPLCFLLPAMFGHGLKGGLFVIIYSQFYKTLPKELEEAAIIDGASTFKLFTRVMLPLAKPAMIVVFLFSMVWHWNETYLVGMFYNKYATMSVKISSISALAQSMAEEMDLAVQPVQMASALLLILPLTIIYIFAQRWFTEGIERTGLIE